MTEKSSSEIELASPGMTSLRMRKLRVLESFPLLREKLFWQMLLKQRVKKARYSSSSSRRVNHLIDGTERLTEKAHVSR